ncbi:helix-turn-helix transcriptional regulator [Evansella halocellulosilytica]|uniref:helix-turn-helix transcriptional regulator n=1 Tax=Evansella halocellulosilytica TaxID=2011013 RepID=UPI000BB73F52|nr:helix-turn-helix transcriptional regulator [Evansella halocellulosilytica]
MLRNRVRELRARFQMTQGDLAKKIGATRQTVGMIEKGDYSPSVTLALKISKEFSMPLEEVFWLESEEES